MMRASSPPGARAAGDSGDGSDSNSGHASDLDADDTPRRSNSSSPRSQGLNIAAVPRHANPFARRGRQPQQGPSFTQGASAPPRIVAPLPPERSRSASSNSGPHRRATHDTALSSLSLDTLQSDCQVRRNSIRFSRDDPEDYDSNSLGSDGSSYVTGRGDMEVMDLRPRMETSSSSLVSLSSNLSMDSELAGGLFQVASGTSAASFNRGMAEIGDALQGDLPGHWERAGAGYGAGYAAHGADGAAGLGIENPLGESAAAYRALLRLMRDGTENARGDVQRENNSIGLNNSLSNSRGNSSGSGHGSGGMRRRESSFCSVETGRSGFWSAIGPFHGGNSLARDEGSTSGSETSQLSDSSPLSKERRKRRWVYMRRCARAIAVVVALAALSLGTMALVAEDKFASVTDLLPDTVWGFFRGGNDETNRYRKLPENAGAVATDETIAGDPSVAGNALTPHQVFAERKARRVAAIVAARHANARATRDANILAARREKDARRREENAERRAQRKVENAVRWADQWHMPQGGVLPEGGFNQGQQALREGYPEEEHPGFEEP